MIYYVSIETEKILQLLIKKFYFWIKNKFYLSEM